MTKSSKSSKTVPEAARKELMALQAKYRALLSMLPFDPIALDCLDAEEFDDALANIELVSNEMVSICDQQMKILAGLDE